MSNQKPDNMQIGDLAKMLGITTRTIRYYEEIGLMEAPPRQDGGIRTYAKEAVLRLKFILKLKELGITLHEMQDIADNFKVHQNSDSIMPRLLEILDLHIHKIDKKISNLSSLRKDIVDYRGRILELLKDKPSTK